MAQIGLKIRGSETGTDLATTLANALMGDPKDEAYLARTRSQIENDEVSRRQGEQDILYRQALTAASQGEEARKAQDTLYDTQAVPYYSQIGVDAMGNPVPAPAPATEAPAIVLESGGRGLPEHLFNQDPRHQAMEPPVPIEDMPLPPQLQGLPPELMPPEMGTITQLGVQRGERGDLTESALPLGGLSPSAIPMPEQLAGVPPELAQAPVRRPVVGAAADNPIVGRGGNPRLNNLLNIFGAGAPVPVLPEDYLTPYQAYDDIAPRAEPGMVPMESLPEAPVPVEPPNIGMVPEDQFDPYVPDLLTPAPEDEVARTRTPQALHDLMRAGEPLPAVDPAPTSAVAPEPPVPVAESGAPTSAAAEPAPPVPPPAEPAAAAPTMPERSELTIKGADDGKADTATTIQTTRAGPIPRAGVEAMVRSIMVGEGTPEGKMQAVQRLLGTLGATYNPQFGQKGQEGVTENLASLRQGGGAVSKDAQISNLNAAEPLPGTAPGTGKDAWISNTFLGVQDAIRSNTPLSPSMADAYAQAYGIQSQPHTELRENAKGQVVPVEVPGYIDPALPTPDAVRAWANGTGPRPVGGAATVAPTPATPPATDSTATPATAPATATVTDSTAAPAAATTTNPATTSSGVVKVGTPLTEAKKTQLTKEAGDNTTYYMNTKSADAEIRDLKKLPDWTVLTATDPLAGGSDSDIITRWATAGVEDYFTKNHPEVIPYWGATQSFASAILRKESGAATRPEDMKTILRRYVPNANDSPEDIKTKALRREIAIEGLRIGAFSAGDEAQRMSEVETYVNNKIAEMKQVRDSGSTPAAAETNNATPTVTTDADYDALPSGTVFTDPEGKRRAKP